MLKSEGDISMNIFFIIFFNNIHLNNMHKKFLIFKNYFIVIIYEYFFGSTLYQKLTPINRINIWNAAELPPNRYNDHHAWTIKVWRINIISILIW